MGECCGWGERNGDGKRRKRQKKEKEKRVGEALNQETERSRHKTKNRTQRPPGFGVYV